MKNEIDSSEALRNKPFMKICMIAACIIFCLYILSSFVFGMAKIRPYLPLCLMIMGCFFAAAGIAIKNYCVIPHIPTSLYDLKAHKISNI